LRSAARRGFTLVETLLALSIISTGIGLLWNGYLVHARLQARLDREVDALDDLAGACEQLGQDADATTALPRQLGPAALDLPTRAGVVHWTDGPTGLERRGADGHLRRFRTLHARSLAVETAGPRMVLVAALLSPGGVDAAVARAIPIGSLR